MADTVTVYDRRAETAFQGRAEELLSFALEATTAEGWAALRPRLEELGRLLDGCEAEAREHELARTPGTVEYRAAIEAAGQGRLPG